MPHPTGTNSSARMTSPKKYLIAEDFTVWCPGAARSVSAGPAAVVDSDLINLLFDHTEHSILTIRDGVGTFKAATWSPVTVDVNRPLLAHVFGR